MRHEGLILESNKMNAIASLSAQPRLHYSCSYYYKMGLRIIYRLECFEQKSRCLSRFQLTREQVCNILIPDSQAVAQFTSSIQGTSKQSIIDRMGCKNQLLVLHPGRHKVLLVPTPDVQ